MSIITDVLGIFDNNFNQIFFNCIAIKCETKETAKAMEHPVEDGSVITDHKIINPIEIELSFIMKPVFYKQSYQQIKTVFLGSNLITIQTKVDSYSNMMIQAMPNTQDPNLFDTITMAVSLKQVIIVQAQYGTLPPSSVSQSKDSSTVDRGEQNPETTEQSSSILKNTGDAIRSII